MPNPFRTPSARHHVPARTLLGLGLAVAVVTGGTLGLGGCAITDGQSTTGQYIDDATITARVKKRLAEDPQVSATRVNVETLNGTVQLSGFATTESERMRAADIARSVPEVTSVRNGLVLRPAQ